MFKAILVSLFMLVSFGVWAEDMEASNGRDSVRIMDKPCSQKIVKLIPKQFQASARAAVSKIDGKSYTACWVAIPNVGVVVKYEDGDEGLISFDQFRPVKNM
jgi:hypothetical protein